MSAEERALADRDRARPVNEVADLASERAAAVDRSLYRVGAEVTYLDMMDVRRSGTIITVDWTREAEPVFVQEQKDDGEGDFRFFQQWEIEVVPEFDSLEDVERFLAGG